jgi:hypothetical protein
MRYYEKIEHPDEIAQIIDNARRVQNAGLQCRKKRIAAEYVGVPEREYAGFYAPCHKFAQGIIIPAQVAFGKYLAQKKRVFKKPSYPDSKNKKDKKGDKNPPFCLNIFLPKSIFYQSLLLVATVPSTYAPT